MLENCSTRTKWKRFENKYREKRKVELFKLFGTRWFIFVYAPRNLANCKMAISCENRGRTQTSLLLHIAVIFVTKRPISGISKRFWNPIVFIEIRNHSCKWLRAYMHANDWFSQTLHWRYIPRAIYEADLLLLLL